MKEQQHETLGIVLSPVFMQPENVCPSCSCWLYLASNMNNTIQMNRLPELKMRQIIKWQMVFPGLLLPHVIPASEQQLPSTPAPCSPQRGCTRWHCCPADGSVSQSSSCSRRCSVWSVVVSARKAWLLAWKVVPSLRSSESISTLVGSPWRLLQLALLSSRSGGGCPFPGRAPQDSCKTHTNK